MYRSLHDVLLPHEDTVDGLPTHGAGSLCSRDRSTSWSTIGYERRHDPCSGRSRSTRSCGPCSRASRLSRATSPGCDRPTRRARGCSAACPRSSRSRDDLTPRCATARCSSTRGARGVRVAHVPGSLSIPAGSSFGTWLGWVVDADRPLVLLVNASSTSTTRPPGAAHRLRVDRRLRRRRAARVARRGPADQGRRRRSTSSDWRPGSRRRAGERRSSSTCGRRPSTRPATSPARSTSVAGELPAMLDRAAARPPDRDRSAPAAIARASRRRCSAAAGFERVVAVGRRAARTGRPSRLPAGTTAGPDGGALAGRRAVRTGARRTAH